jgi:dUTP pyrophosphatase
MQFVRVREVIQPTRANKTDAGIDFFVPIDLSQADVLNKNPKLVTTNLRWDASGQYKNKVTKIILKPQERVLIPSGIHVKLPKDHALIAFNKSGIAHSAGLVVGSQVVDEGYEGELHISLINTTKEVCIISAGAKIVQFLCLPVNYTMPEEIKEPILEFYADSGSTRGEGGFGSTNK